ncbi:MULTISPECIES: VOC family protein [Streptomyces]|uniref:VOC family protein n=1 Tax=Streptomyces eurythermus TaxID=42237 RepID=A0ABW6Z2Z6_9ACTN|nr:MULTISPECIES: VOC family protein [Streptomyces]QIS69587.1 glyoxalase/bleomycin resistance/dioxygenase family protein [Streptomyces sp. DSM 40868]
MAAGLQTIIYPVKDLDRAKALFGALLGVEPYADEPYYVGYKAAGQDVGLDPSGHAKGMTGPVPYWHVTDLRERLAALLAAGAELLQDAQDVGGGRLIAFVKDPDGNHVGLLQDPSAPSNPSA